MKAVEVQIHNYRSVCDATISTADCGVLVGVNNAGKTAVIDAIRAFYGKGLKFDRNRDFPHRGAVDNESWVEIEFKPSNDELANLREEYKAADHTFRIRSYLFSDQKDADGKERSGPYAYIEGRLSDQRFYGAKTVGQGRFGDIIYIPAASRVDEHTKLTGPSALRDLLNAVLAKVMGQSPAYQALSESFTQFEAAIKNETTVDGYSMQGIESDISSELAGWGAGFKLNIDPVGIDQVVKDLISYEIVDGVLGRGQPISSYGQGLQRSLIYTLIRIAAKYNMKKPLARENDFVPELTWILFEEPEAFLHPTQISVLSGNLRALAATANCQVLLSSHNPLFATSSIREISAICRLQRYNCQTSAYQISEQQLAAVLASNQQDAQAWQAAGIPIDPDDLLTDMEAVKYALWLDGKRCGAFFAEKVLLVEGPTETTLLSYMRDQGLLPSCSNVFILDTIGKYNIHRFMRLLECFGIKHCVLYDGDNGRYAAVDATIQAAANPCTVGIDAFTSDLEEFLAIPPARQKHRKPQHVMLHVEQNQVDLNALASKVNALVSGGLMPL